jgi:twitching motility protein PilT
MVERNASDLYLKAGCVPYLRIDGKLTPCGTIELSEQDVAAAVGLLMNSSDVTEFKKDWEKDLAYSVRDLGRFRVNAYIQRGTPALVFRSIRSAVLTFAELNLPVEVLERLSMEPRGLVLFTGNAGCGKSTTLASMLKYINQNARKHIITIEDPVEFIHTDEKSIISQREVGLDTHSFAEALRHVLRQSPDVILIGEMRDLETMNAAITAAETGHLVLSTLHTVDATQTVERIINFFPPYQHAQIRMELSLVLRGVISQRLLNRRDASGRLPACEVMLSTPTIRKVILEGRTTQLYSVIKEGEIFGLQTFNQALIRLYKEGKITRDEALANADRPEELELTMRGVFVGKDTHTAVHGA